MFAEAPEKTVERWIQTTDWVNSPIHVLSKDLRSSGNESRGEWDAFYYEEQNGVLFDPVRNKPIVGTDGGDIAQKKVNQDLQDWFLTSDEGIVVRISPHGGKWKYPDEQIEIYRITYEYPSLEKKLFCSFLQFHANLKNPEEIRQFIFPEKDSEEAIFEIINWVESVSKQKVSTNIVALDARTQEANYHAERLKSGIDPHIVLSEMKKTGFLGDKPIGCSSVEIYNSKTNLNSGEVKASQMVLEGTYCKNCGVCGAVIESYITPGYVCKSCGEMYKGIC